MKVYAVLTYRGVATLRIVGIFADKKEAEKKREKLGHDFVYVLEFTLQGAAKPICATCGFNPFSLTAVKEKKDV